MRDDVTLGTSIFRLKPEPPLTMVLPVVTASHSVKNTSPKSASGCVIKLIWGASTTHKASSLTRGDGGTVKPTEAPTPVVRFRKTIVASVAPRP